MTANPREHARHRTQPIRGSVQWTFPDVTGTTKVAQIFTAATLTRWGAATIADDAAIVAGELLANAIVASRPPLVFNHAAVTPHSPSIDLRILALPDSIAIEASDRSTREPALQPHDLTAERGRGLQIVDALSRQWGFYRTPDGGKVVWAEIAVPPAPPRDRRLPAHAAQQ